MKTRSVALVLCLSLLASVTPPSFELISPVRCQEVFDSQKRDPIKVELYFGLSSTTREISEQEWQQFLSEEITRRFPEGLTVLESYGQYQNSSGILLKERTKIVIIILENQPSNYQKIQEIIKLFKDTFQQESVLKVITPVQAEFWINFSIRDGNRLIIGTYNDPGFILAHFQV